MLRENIQVVGLFACNRKSINQAYKEGVRWFNTDYSALWVQGCIFHPDFWAYIMDEANYTRSAQFKHFDRYVEQMLRETGIKPWIHIPSLLQHNVHAFASCFPGHWQNEARKSKVFKPKFIQEYYEGVHEKL